MRVTKAFKLVNGSGSVLDISGSDYFFTNISGMGFGRDNKFQSIGSQYKLVSNSFRQSSIKGDVYIYGDDSAAKKYKDFVEFCMSEPVRLLHTPETNGKEYTVNVLVSSIEIAERNIGMIVAKVTFDTLGNWYRDVYSSVVAGGIGKTYDYQYSYQYNDTEKGTAFVDVDTSLPSGTVIEIVGPCVNPIWKYYIDGKLAGEGKADISIEAGNKLVIDTTTIPYTMSVLDMKNQVISNAYNVGDFNTQRFFLAKKGRNRVSIVSQARAETDVLLKVRMEYASI